MYSRPNHFWVTLLAAGAVWATLVSAGVVRAANSPPLAEAWSITSAGEATSSGEMVFRVSGDAGRKPLEVTVYVLSGANETGVASSIRRALATQLEGSRLTVEAGEGANVLLSSAGPGHGFSVELLDSDIENIRVTVQSASPIAPPTVAPQQLPATPPASARTPATPEDGTPAGSGAAPAPAAPETPAPTPVEPPTSPSANQEPTAPPLTERTPDSPSGGAGAPASAPPPPPGQSS